MNTRSLRFGARSGNAGYVDSLRREAETMKTVKRMQGRRLKEKLKTMPKREKLATERERARVHEELAQEGPAGRVEAHTFKGSVL